MDRLDLPDPFGDDLLGQRTRRRLFMILGQTEAAASTEELAEQLGLHPNGIRAHLQRMREAGVVVRHRVPRPRGRPRDEWELAPTARPGGDPPSAYGALASWLARTIPANPARLREVEAAGREIGQEIAPVDKTSVKSAVAAALTRLGFQPEVHERPPARLSCRLRNCPYRDAVHANQEVVCALHRGITRGLLDVIAPDATLERFVPHDPTRAGCEIEIQGVAGLPG